MTGFDTIVSLKKSIWGVTNVDIEARVRVLGLKNSILSCYWRFHKSNTFEELKYQFEQIIGM